MGCYSRKGQRSFRSCCTTQRGRAASRHCRGRPWPGARRWRARRTSSLGSPGGCPGRAASCRSYRATRGGHATGKRGQPGLAAAHRSERDRPTSIVSPVIRLPIAWMPMSEGGLPRSSTGSVTFRSDRPAWTFAPRWSVEHVNFRHQSRLPADGRLRIGATVLALPARHRRAGHLSGARGATRSDARETGGTKSTRHREELRVTRQDPPVPP
jgi:hypothetical protein